MYQGCAELRAHSLNLADERSPAGVGRLFGAMSAKSGPVCVCGGGFQRRLSAGAHHFKLKLLFDCVVSTVVHSKFG